MYRWTGCGFYGGIGTKHHKQKIQVQSGKLAKLSRGCIMANSGSLTPLSLSTGKEMVALRIYDEETNIYSDKTLKYDDKKVGSGVVDGFYWDG